MWSILDIHDLQCFRLAYEARSLGKAADQAYLTRQALSHVIRNLETEIGQPLFNRGIHGLEPTELATHAYPAIMKLLEDYAEVQETLSGRALLETVRLCVAYGAFNSIPFDLFFQRFQTEHPTIKLEVDVLEPVFCERCVADGAADLALIVGVYDGPHTECQSFGKAHLYAAVQESLLPAKEKRVFADLEGLTWFGLSPEFPLDAALIGYSDRRGLGLKMDYTYHDYHLILDQVRKGQGACMVPEYYVDQFCTDGIVALPFDEIDWSWELSLIYPKERALPKSAQIVRGSLIGYFS